MLHCLSGPAPPPTLRLWLEWQLRRIDLLQLPQARHWQGRLPQPKHSDPTTCYLTSEPRTGSPQQHTPDSPIALKSKLIFSRQVTTRNVMHLAASFLAVLRGSVAIRQFVAASRDLQSLAKERLVETSMSVSICTSTSISICLCIYISTTLYPSPGPGRLHWQTFEQLYMGTSIKNGPQIRGQCTMTLTDPYSQKAPPLFGKFHICDSELQDRLGSWRRPAAQACQRPWRSCQRNRPGSGSGFPTKVMGSLREGGSRGEVLKALGKPEGALGKTREYWGV